MRRVVAAVVLVAGGAIACTTFDFPPPSGATSADASSEASVDATVHVDAGTDGGTQTPFLDVADAASLCTLIFECPRLAQAIEASLVIPLDTPSVPLNFSGCMDWLAGPVDPDRVGLKQQQTILSDISGRLTCAGAYSASPVHPVEAGGSCLATSCSDPNDFETCSPEAGAFMVECDAAVFGPPADGVQRCAVDDGGTAVCLAGPPCPRAGLSCDDNTLIDCYGVPATKHAYSTYNCALSGRACISGGGAADCVVPGKLASPCPDGKPDDECDITGGVNAVKHCAGGLLAQTEFDCAAVGRTCSTASGVARCVGPNDACTPFDPDENQCSDGGSSISVCIGGVKSSFDCGLIGKACIKGDALRTGHCG
jgi:hypothetical protein